MKDKKKLQEMMDYYFQMFYLPIFLCDTSLSILLSSKKFIEIKQDFFLNLISQVHPEQQIHMILEDGCCYIILFYDLHYIVIGPILYTRQEATYSTFMNTFTDSFKSPYGYRLPYMNHRLIASLQFLYLFLYDEIITIDIMDTIDLKLKKSIDEGQLKESLRNENEYESPPFSYHTEVKLLRSIQKGNIRQATIMATQYCNILNGDIADSQASIQKDALTAILILIARAIITCDVPLHKAYKLQHIYLHKMKDTFTIQQNYDLFMQAIVSNCKLVKEYKNKQYPVWIRTCLENISEHVHDKITLQDLANEVYLSTTYISITFKEIIGVTLVDYINEQKIEEAKYLLKSSNLSILEIAESLGFTNSYYFTRVFKKHVNIVPSKYRNS